MPITHTNREGDVYYLHVTRTKTGRTGYHFSRKAAGELVDSVPDGYEIYEKPSNAQVFLRRVRPKSIADEEVALVRRGVLELTEVRHPILDVEGKSLVIYTPGRSRGELERLVEELSPFGRLGLERKVAELERRGPYCPMLRFTLADEKRRWFRAARWCFRGQIDGWISLLGADGTLAELTSRYAPHLDRESFFDLM